MSAATFTEDFKPTDLVIAIAVACIVIVGGGVAVSVASLGAHAALPEIDKGGSQAVRVIPVLDLDTPLLKLGGKRDKMKLPERWVRQKPVPVTEQRAVVTTKAGQTADDIPDKEMKIIDAGAEVPDPDAGIVVKKSDSPVTEASDAGPTQVDGPGSPAGVKEGTETDPLKAMAVDQYKIRVASWLRGGFRVHGTGLPPEEITKYKVHATVQLSGDRTVSGFNITPSGNAAFDAAATAALEAKRGQAVPPPPENYPDVKFTVINVQFQCSEKTCD